MRAGCNTAIVAEGDFTLESTIWLESQAPSMTTPVSFRRKRKAFSSLAERMTTQSGSSCAFVRRFMVLDTPKSELVIPNDPPSQLFQPLRQKLLRDRGWKSCTRC